MKLSYGRYKPNVDEGLKLANAPSNIPVVVFQRSHILNADLEGSNDIHWQDEVIIILFVSVFVQRD